MIKEQEGIVIFTDGEMAKVRTSRHSHCENCGSCPGDAAIVLETLNSINVSVGERVAIKMQEKNMLKAAFVVFVLPLLAIATGALLGGRIVDCISIFSILTGQIFGGLLFLLGAIFYIKKFENKVSANREMKAIILRKL